MFRSPVFYKLTVLKTMPMSKWIGQKQRKSRDWQTSPKGALWQEGFFKDLEWGVIQRAPLGLEGTASPITQAAGLGYHRAHLWC
jgi:hypothetical protein